MSNLNRLGQTSSEIGMLADRGYRLLSKLSAGSFATVTKHVSLYQIYSKMLWPTQVFLSEYKASDSKDIERIACKVIDTKQVKGNIVTKFLPRELDILVKIHHPHIIEIHGTLQFRQKYFIFKW